MSWPHLGFIDEIHTDQRHDLVLTCTYELPLFVHYRCAKSTSSCHLFPGTKTNDFVSEGKKIRKAIESGPCTGREILAGSCIVRNTLVCIDVAITGRYESGASASGKVKIGCCRCGCVVLRPDGRQKSYACVSVLYGGVSCLGSQPSTREET